MDLYKTGAGRDLVEKELGHVALELLECLNIEKSIIPSAEIAAVRLLEDIRSAMDNASLSDFDCIEKIDEILYRAGIVTSRHDFG